LNLSKNLILLLASLVVGVLVVVVSAFWIRSHNATELVTVVVAAQKIESGVSLRAEYLRTTDWPKASLPHGAETSIDKLLGRVTRTPVEPNELILERMLLHAGASGSLAAVITPGMRAVAIPVNEVAGVAGFAFPGNYVDVLLSTKDDSGQATSKIVLQRVLVLAVDQDRSIKDETKGRIGKAVTLEVTPQQAEKIDVARAVGTLSLALRSQEDGLPGSSSGARKGDFGLTQAGSTEPQSGQPAVEVIRGTTRRVETGFAQ
jgi:pilus assembly protein CpaB